MLTMQEPPQQTRTLPPGLRRFDWQLFLIAWCSAFHLVTAITLMLAPYDQVNNAATAPVLAMGSRYLWGALFLAAAALSGMVARRMCPGWALMVTGLLVFPLGAAWLAAFSIAVLQGHGSALSVCIWPFLYGPWSVAVVRVGLGKR